jgi:hypothetical protein
MKVYNLSKDAVKEDDHYMLSELCKDEYEWVVYEYEAGDYCGSGDMVALAKDGQLHYQDLGHCSCYGPTEGWPQEKLVVADIYGETGNALNCPFQGRAVEAKVRELLGL